ncbi:hypothetical protein PLCT2_02392 [Planctomycetaceae bacterium]|nr:hypothetical protein PLCT2_02392 [Planctomycetaceae bacterium]
MKRNTTLLTLVALVLAFLALQSFQPTGRPRAVRSDRAARAEQLLTGQHRDARTSPRVHTAPLSQGAPSAPALVQEPAAGKASVPSIDAGTTPTTQEPPTGTPPEVAGHSDATASEPTPEIEPPLTAEEEELTQKRSGHYASLKWLRDHQCEDGRWSASEFGAASRRRVASHSYNVEFFAPGLAWGDQGQSPDNDFVVTALVLLAHINTGFDHKDGMYKDSMRRAIKWLRSQQDACGRFGPEHDIAFLPTHALCTAALAECYGMSGDAALKKNCETAVTHLLTLQTKDSGFARNPYGYGLDPEPDTATTAWSVLALKYAKIAGIEFEMTSVGNGVLAFLDSVTTVIRGTADDVAGVTTRLRVRGGDSPDGRAGGFISLNTLDAMNCYCRCMLATEDYDHKLCIALAKKGVAQPPTWDERSIDFVHWFFATSAAYQCLSWRPTGKNGRNADKGWTDWEQDIAKVLLAHQRGYRVDELKTWPAMLDEFGSWDAVDAYSRQGGRVYTSAMAHLILQIYYRYRRQTKD